MLSWRISELIQIAAQKGVKRKREMLQKNNLALA